MSDVIVEAVVKVYGDVMAVDHVAFEVKEGEFFSLLGPSGCGKSTTLRMIAGLVEPDGGLIHISGELVNNKPVHLRKIGMVFQNFALFPHMNIFENVSFGLRMQEKKETEIRNRVEAALELVQLSGFEKRFPRELSGGQQQRVALARAIVTEPKVLLLDEPMSNLDAKLREKMRVDLKQLQDRLGITTIYVTHDQAEALILSSRIAIMNKGHIEQIGTPVEIYERPASNFVAEFVGEANVFKGEMVVEKHQNRFDGVVIVNDQFQIRVHPPQSMDRREVLTMVRPERVFVNSECIEGENVFHGKVTFVEYRGSSVQYHVILDSMHRVISTEQRSGAKPLYHVDQQVWVHWRIEDCSVTPISE